MSGLALSIIGNYRPTNTFIAAVIDAAIHIEGKTGALNGGSSGPTELLEREYWLESRLAIPAVSSPVRRRQPPQRA